MDYAGAGAGHDDDDDDDDDDIILRCCRSRLLTFSFVPARRKHSVVGGPSFKLKIVIYLCSSSPLPLLLLLSSTSPPPPLLPPLLSPFHLYLSISPTSLPNPVLLNHLRLLSDCQSSREVRRMILRAHGFATPNAKERVRDWIVNNIEQPVCKDDVRSRSPVLEHRRGGASVKDCEVESKIAGQEHVEYACGGSLK
eukprot:753264-Hanusia_phi.AAC.5